MIAFADLADPTRVYTGTDTRAFSLLLGALVATGPVRVPPARTAGRSAGALPAFPAAGRSAGALLAFPACGIGTAWFLVDGVDSPWLFTGGLFAHSLASALLIGLCARAPHTLVARVLARQPLRWLGLSPRTGTSKTADRCPAPASGRRSGAAV